jgi:CheY-like chemotaxis protein
MIRWLGGQLERTGWDVIDADNGARAIERYETERPDLVVLDQYMPGMGGLDVARHIRSKDADVMLMMFSASVDPKVLDEAERLVVLFVSKINLDSLLQELERLHTEYARAA